MTEEFCISNEATGKRIRELREKKGMTQDALAEILSVGTNGIGCYERGEYGPSRKSIHTMCKYFGVSADYLLHGEKESVDTVLKSIHRFSDVDKMKIMIRLLFYFMHGKSSDENNKGGIETIRNTFEYLFEIDK